MKTFTKLQPRYAYAGQFKLENLLPGLRGQSIGSSLTSIDLSGVTTLTLPQMATVTGGTGSFTVLNITTAEVTGGTGTTAALKPVGSAAGGPATAAQDGWMLVNIAGTQVYVPVWK